MRLSGQAVQFRLAMVVEWSMKRFGPGALGHVLVAAAMLAGTGGALAGGLYDGTYHGTLMGAGMNAMTCAKSAPAQMTVSDGKLEYHHMGNAVITATVA